MFDFDYVTKEDLKEQDPTWPEIPDHSHRILIVGGSGSGKANALLNLINNEPDIDKIYLYTKDPYEAKYQLLINKRESTGLNYLNNSKAFIEYSNNMGDIYKNIEDHDPNKKWQILIVFDDMIGDMFSNKKLNPIVTELFIRGRKLIISIVFITQSYFAVHENIRLNSTHYFVLKIPNKRELQQIAFNRSSDIDFQDFMNPYKKCTAKPCPFLVIDTTLAPYNSLRFRKNLLKIIQKLIMTIDDKIKDEKLRYDINREAAKIALSSVKIDKYKYLIGEEILTSNQNRIIEQGKITYSPLSKAF